MQIEDNTKKMQFFFMVEMQLSLYKEDTFAGKDKAQKGVVATSELFQKTPRPNYQNCLFWPNYALEEIGHTNLPRVVLALGSVLA